ncbi:MAG: tetratricopeptide repeat protein [Thermodesulfobacteriota bacterium]
MSLIMDALKRTQQLRLKESKGTPFFKNPSPKDGRARKSLRKRWIAIGAVLVSLVIVIFVFLRPSAPPLAPETGRPVAIIEKKALLPVVEKKPQEPAEEIPSLESISRQKEMESVKSSEGPKDTLSHAKEILGQSKVAQEEKPTSGMRPSVDEKKEEPPERPPPEKKEVMKANLPIPRSTVQDLSAAGRRKPSYKRSVKKDLSSTPTHLSSLKEEGLSKPSAVEKGEEKDQPITTEAIRYFNLGICFYNQRETPKAIQAYQKAIELNRAYIEAYNNLGIIYQEAGDFNRAIEVYQKAIEINPQYEKAYNNLGILFLLKGRVEEATEAFQKALTINPSNVESLINLGVLFRQQGQSEKAIEFYQKALTINPLRGETHYNIALLYEEMDEVDLAVDHYGKFIQLSSKTHPVLTSKVQGHLNDLLRVRNNKEGLNGQGFKTGSRE